MLEDAAGMGQLRSAGMRALPVVARGDEYVAGIDLEKVAALLGLTYDATPLLSPAQLISRYERVLSAAARHVAQIPDARLSDKLPHRDRSYLTLVNHLVQIAADFLKIADGADFAGRLAESVPRENLDVAGLRERVAELKQALESWLAQASDADYQRSVNTYFGEQTLHQVLERAVWHSAQHARQLMMVLEMLAIVPERPLVPADFRGLPMPQDVWDG